jgi:predicted DNA-binding transcriptional regulator YafY
MKKIERLINLIALLLQARQPVTVDELMETVYREKYLELEEKGADADNALRRMFERDKDELRDMGIELKTVGTDDEPGYIIASEDYYLPELDLGPAERVGLSMACRLFYGSQTPFSGLAHTAMLKFQFDEDAGEEGPYLHWVDSPRFGKLLSPVVEGLTGRKNLVFSYRSIDSKKSTRRTVSPYGLFNRNGHWYLVGECHLRGEVRSFKMDRITSKLKVNRTKPHTPDFEIPEEFDLGEVARWEWSGSREREPVEARVLFRSGLPFGLSGGGARQVDLEPVDEGGSVATYLVTDPDQFVAWVLELGAGVRILEPPELVEMIRDRIRGALRAVGEGA